MTPERWELIGETYHKALELAPAARTAFLEEIGTRDGDLRREVESLITASEEAGEFIDSPALNDAARLMATRGDLPDWRDRKEIGHYRLKSLLGVGGMGEVYLALDVRLNRKVAIKLLHPEAARDRIAKERLFREARAVAALNHENIVAIHSIEEIDDAVFIVMEYVDGRTLTEAIAEGKLTLPEALEIGAQIAHALEAAHLAGLIHRDIKPGNVLLTRSGQVKLLDFGIARIIEEAISGETDSREFLAPLTAEGRILGTAAYMSPEQVRGETLDPRSDIFSLGALLYEAITGSSPFRGSGENTLTHAIVTSEPLPPTRLKEKLPPRIDSILQRALSKDRNQRYSSANEFAAELIDLKQSLETDARSISVESPCPDAPTAEIVKAVPQVAPANRIFTPTMAVATVAIIATLLLGSYVLLGRGRRILAVTPTEERLTNSGNVASGAAAVSRDGRYIVYAVQDSPRRSSLWLRQIGTSSMVRLSAPGEVTFGGATFSRDGNYIFFVQRDRGAATSTLYRIPLLGGAPTRIIDDLAGPVSFSPQGDRFTFRRNSRTANASELIVASADGGNAQRIASLNSPEFFGDPSWSPDGKLIACSAGHSDGGANRYLVGIAVNGWQTRTISRHKWRWIGNTEWLADGSGLLMIATDSTLEPYRIWQLSYPGGEETRVTSNSSIYSRLSLAGDSSAILVAVVRRSTNMWVVTPGQPQLARKITFGVGGFRSFFDWTPQRTIVFDSEVSSVPDISIMDEDGSNQRPLLGDLTAKGTAQYPTVTFDGRYIVFAFDKDGSRHVWRMDIDGRNLLQLTNGSGEDHPHCSPDGKWVVFTSIGSDVMTLWRVSIDGGEPQQLTSTPSKHPAVSPDGKSIAYLSSTAAASEWRISVMPFEGGSPSANFPQLVSSNYPAKWTNDGTGLTYMEPDQTSILVQPLNGGAPRPIVEPANDLIFGFDWSPDGRQLALVRGIWERDLVLIRNFR